MCCLLGGSSALPCYRPWKCRCCNQELFSLRYHWELKAFTVKWKLSKSFTFEKQASYSPRMWQNLGKKCAIGNVFGFAFQRENRDSPLISVFLLLYVISSSFCPDMSQLLCVDHCEPRLFVSYVHISVFISHRESCKVCILRFGWQFEVFQCRCALTLLSKACLLGVLASRLLKVFK